MASTLAHERDGDESNRWYRAGFRIGRLVGTVLRRHATPAAPACPVPADPPVPDPVPARLVVLPTASPRRARWVPAGQTVAACVEGASAALMSGRSSVWWGIQLIMHGVRVAGLIAGGASGATVALEIGRLAWDVFRAGASALSSSRSPALGWSGSSSLVSPATS